MSIIIIDEFTGRLMIGRQWSDGLHQAVEAKHARDGVQDQGRNADPGHDHAAELLQAVQEAGRHDRHGHDRGQRVLEDLQARRHRHPDQQAAASASIIPTSSSAPSKEKWEAVVEEIVEVHKAGRPILIGTTDVDKSNKLSEMLKRRGIKHELLNAKPEHAAREAEIVAQAGRIGAVTIATNMAGRGTDIILGGNPETLAWAQLKDKYATRLDVPEDVWKQHGRRHRGQGEDEGEGRKVAEMGGLHIIGTERHEARRIDNQLRGRAGRQGDPGSSRFYLSLQDDLMRIFAGEWVAGVLTRLGMEEGQAIESRMVSRAASRRPRRRSRNATSTAARTCSNTTR